VTIYVPWTGMLAHIFMSDLSLELDLRSFVGELMCKIHLVHIFQYRSTRSILMLDDPVWYSCPLILGPCLLPGN